MLILIKRKLTSKFKDNNMISKYFQSPNLGKDTLYQPLYDSYIQNNNKLIKSVCVLPPDLQSLLITSYYVHHTIL